MYLTVTGNSGKLRGGRLRRYFPVHFPSSGRVARAPADDTDTKADAIGRAVRTLFLFDSAACALTLDEICQRTKVPKPTLLGILQTLSHHDYLVFDPADSRYRLGYAWLRFAEIRRNQSHIRESALPIMRAMRDAVDETVILSLKVGDQRIHLDYVESTQPIRRRRKPSREAPLHRGCAGLVLLAGMSEENIRAYLSAQKELNQAARDDVLNTIRTIKRDGYASSSGQTTQVAVVSGPIKSYTGETIASLSISGPAERFSKQMVQEWAALVLEGARKLSRTLGYGLA